jgi:hypothetical protein
MLLLFAVRQQPLTIMSMRGRPQPTGPNGLLLIIIIHAELYTARAAACKGVSHRQAFKNYRTLCDPVVPLLVAFNDPL